MNKKVFIAIVTFCFSSVCYADKNKEDVKYFHPFISACISSGADIFDKCGLVSRNGLPVTPARYQVIDKYQDIWLALKENGHTDVLDIEGHVVGTIPGGPAVPPRRTVIKISDNLLLAKKAHALYDYHGTLIHVLQPLEYYTVDGGSDDIIGVVRITGDGIKKGYMDIYTGAWILAPIYSSISQFHQGYASVTVKKENEFYSTVIDKKGKELFPFTPDTSYYWISNNRWIKSYDSSRISEYVDIINDKGNTLLSQVRVEPYSYSEYVVIVQKQQTSGCYVVKLSSMEEKLIAENCSSGKFSDGVIWIRFIQREGLNPEWVLFDEYGKELFRRNYVDGQEFHNGFAIVVDENKKWGVVNKKGETIIPFEYSAIATPWSSHRQSISEGVWRVRKKGVNGYMYIDNDNKVIATLTRDSVPPESPCGKYNPVYSLKNAQGEILWQKDLEETCKTITSFRSGKKWQ